MRSAPRTALVCAEIALCARTHNRKPNATALWQRANNALPFCSQSAVWRWRCRTQFANMAGTCGQRTTQTSPPAVATASAQRAGMAWIAHVRRCLRHCLEAGVRRAAHLTPHTPSLACGMVRACCPAVCTTKELCPPLTPPDGGPPIPASACITNSIVPTVEEAPYGKLISCW